MIRSRKIDPVHFDSSLAASGETTRKRIYVCNPAYGTTGNTMRDRSRNVSGGRRRCGASITKVELRITQLQDRLALMTLQMRRSLLSLCGEAGDKGDNVMHQIFRLRQRMVLTKRRINHLKFHDRAGKQSSDFHHFRWLDHSRAREPEPPRCKERFAMTRWSVNCAWPWSRSACRVWMEVKSLMPLRTTLPSRHVRYSARYLPTPMMAISRALKLQTWPTSRTGVGDTLFISQVSTYPPKFVAYFGERGFCA